LALVVPSSKGYFSFSVCELEHYNAVTGVQCLEMADDISIVACGRNVSKTRHAWPGDIVQQQCVCHC
jgi:hypothetical protein